VKIIFKAIFLFFLLNTGLYAQSDCPDAIVVCGNDDYYGLDATGIGVQELTTNVCSSVEHNTIWLKVMIKDGGTLGFVITPEEIDDLVVDFDFWIFGPNVTCDDLGTSIRCSTTNPLAAGLDYNTTGMNDVETDVSEGPGADGNSFIEWMEVNDDDIYYLIIDRPHGASNFSLEWTGTATFHDIPSFNNPDNIPLDIVKCDNDGIDDESTTFDLTIYETMFFGDQTDVELTYHLSENDMVTGENPIENPESFVNTSTPQTIYMKMTNEITGCYSNESFTISVTAGIGTPEDIKICDDDGIYEFDFSDNEIALLNENTNASITYYTSLENAENLVDAIESPYQNQTPYQSEEIWARLDKTDEDCIDFASFIIEPLNIPVFQTPNNTPLDITICNGNTPIIFDLTINEDLMRGTQENILFTYYEDIAGEPSVTPISSPENYNSTSPPQLIHIKISNNSTECYTMGTFTINATPGAGVPENLTQCGDGGIATFNLSINDNIIINGNENTIVNYYSTEEDAINQENTIGPEYQNQIAFTSETIWARMDKTEEGCTDYVSFTINPSSNPIFNAQNNTPPDITLCDNDGTDDGLVIFDLTINETTLQGEQENISFTYYEDNDGTPSDTPITSPEEYSNTTSPQIIHVTITNTTTECTTNSSFNLFVTPSAGIPENLHLCDSNGIAEFNLSENNETIANGNDGVIITYFLTEIDAQNNENSINTLYENTIAFEDEQIWARVEMPDGNCYDTTSFTISVTSEPILYNLDDIDINLIKCDRDGTDDIATSFDLTEHEIMFTNDQNNVEFSYYLTLEDAVASENEIETPESFINTSSPQTIYIRLTNTLTGCYTTENFSITIDYTLTTGEPQDLLLCDTEENGYQLFNLSENTALISNGLSNTAVTYYASLENAENEINALSNFYTNATPYFNQTIWARLENTAGCFGYGITSFTIGILPLPEIDYTLNIVDFTSFKNSISITINNNPEAYEFSMDGIIYTDNNIFQNLIPNLYTVYIRSKDNCKTIEIEVPILNYPKFFTPNGDGTNEVWNVSNIYSFPKARVIILDRYGKIIKSYLGNQKGWDGTYNGRNLPSTDYWFMLEFNSGRIINGHFSLIR